MARSPRTATTTSKAGKASSAMAERVVYTILREGFDLAPTSDAFIDRLFWRLDDDERHTIKTLLVQQPPQIVHGYPRRTQGIPQIAIAVAQEGDEDPKPLGDFLGIEDDEFAESESTKVGVYGEPVKSTLQVWIYATTPDVCQYLYLIAYTLLKAARDEFLAQQLTPGRMSGGDVAPREDLLPEFAFGRMIQAEYTGLRTFAVDTPFLRQVMVRVRQILTR